MQKIHMLFQQFVILLLMAFLKRNLGSRMKCMMPKIEPAVLLGFQITQFLLLVIIPHKIIFNLSKMR